MERSRRREAGIGGLVLGAMVLGGAFLWSDGAESSSQDSLAPELRARVERLKVEARIPTTDRQTLLQRLDVLWEWVSAHALDGGVIPVNFTYEFGICYRALNGSVDRWAPVYSEALSAEDGTIPAENISEFVARSVREFQIKDENPDAIGQLAISDPGPYVVGEPFTIQQTFTVGEMPLVSGGGILVANNSFSAFQADNPAEDNYVSVSCSKEGVRLEKTPAWGRWGTRLTRPVASYRLVGGSLTEGDTITVTYGDRSAGGGGVVLRPWAIDAYVLPLFVDLEGTGHMLSPAWPTFGVKGRAETAFVNAIAPSVVAPGEAFELAVRSEDRYKNPITGRSPSYRVLLGGREVATIPPAGEPVSVIPGLRLGEPGVYRFDISSADGRLEARSNPVWVRPDAPYRIYWGDTHGHVGLADGQGSADGYFRFGRDFARLDFLTLSEHDIWTDAAEWRLLQEKTRDYLEPGTFTTFLGYEWTFRITSGGHHNVYFRTAEGRRQVGNHTTVDLDELFRGLRRVHSPEDVLVIPHVHRPGDWRRSDGGLERLAEIQSGHGTFEWYGNRYLANGFEVGFIGSSDNHSTNPGYSPGKNRQLGGLAAVLAGKNAPDELFDALRARSCYATTGERIILDVSLNGRRMGERVRDAGRRTITCRVMGTEPIDAVDVVKNGDVVFTKRYLKTELGSRATVQIMLFSSSEVLTEYTYPRGERDWNAQIQVQGARLLEVKDPWFFGPSTYTLTRDPTDPNRLHFATGTRGRGKAPLLYLEGASADTEIVVSLAPGREDPRVGTGDDRGPQPLPAAEISFRLGDLLDGPRDHELPIVRHVDSVSAQLVPDDASLDQEFSYVDQGELRPGDYYYVRVRQVDGSVAWSSPFWADGVNAQGEE